MTNDKEPRMTTAYRREPCVGHKHWRFDCTCEPPEPGMPHQDDCPMVSDESWLQSRKEDGCPGFTYVPWPESHQLPDKVSMLNRIMDLTEQNTRYREALEGARDALVARDINEAYHRVYWGLADPATGKMGAKDDRHAL